MRKSRSPKSKKRKIIVLQYRCEVKIITIILHILVNHTPLSSDLAGVNFEVNLNHERLSL